MMAIMRDQLENCLNEELEFTVVDGDSQFRINGEIKAVGVDFITLQKDNWITMIPLSKILFVQQNTAKGNLK